jgi:hypothetical protein
MLLVLMSCCVMLFCAVLRTGRALTKIARETWQELADVCAGDVLLTELQICSMQGRKNGQFYPVSHSVQLPKAPSQPPPPQAPATAAATAATIAAAAEQSREIRDRKRPAAAAAAGSSPLAGAKRRFRRLLDALVCRRREELGHVDAGVSRPAAS